MSPATPIPEILRGTSWTVQVFEFAVIRESGRIWLYVIPSPRGLKEEFDRLKAGGIPVLWTPSSSFPELSRPRPDLAPIPSPTDLLTAFRAWKCHVRRLILMGYSVNREIGFLNPKGDVTPLT